MRVLPERSDHDRQGAPRSQPASNRSADPRRHGADAVPLHDVLPRSGRDQARGGRTVMKRRIFLKTSGALIVTLSASKFMGPIELLAQASGPYPDPDFHQLDSWIVIHENNTATFYAGKTDCGQGTGTAFRQMLAAELDIDYDQTNWLLSRTDFNVDEGGSGGSDAIQTDGWPMRRVAAEARRVLLDMASAKFGVPVEALTVSSAVIAVKADPSKRITYGELIGGKKFHVALTGANIDATTGIAKVKPVQDLKIVGQSPQRYDIPAKVDGTQQWAVDVKLPGMVHARNVKPPVAGATLVSIDDASVRSLPGFIKVVSKGNYVAVVCEREEQAIDAAKKLQVSWKETGRAALPGLAGSSQVHAVGDADVEPESCCRGQSGRRVRLG